MREISGFKTILKKAIRYFSNRFSRSIATCQVSNILSRKRGHCYYDDENVFETLQKKYPEYPIYGYTHFSIWNRGLERIKRLLRFDELQKSGKKLLEVGSGDGFLGSLLSCYGHDVSLIDIEDWRYKKANTLKFAISDVGSGLPLPSNEFFFVYSYNTFEHVEDPERSFSEILRVTQPGGIIFLEFGPLYTSPWGLHAYRTFHMPYPQFLFSTDFIESKLDKLGIYDLGRKRDSLQYLNRKRISDFEYIWKSSDCKILSYEKIRDYSHFDVIIEYPEAFAELNLTIEDVTVQAISIALKKN